jgi:hypothetical protein
MSRLGGALAHDEGKGPLLRGVHCLLVRALILLGNEGRRMIRATKGAKSCGVNYAHRGSQHAKQPRGIVVLVVERHFDGQRRDCLVHMGLKQHPFQAGHLQGCRKDKISDSLWSVNLVDGGVERRVRAHNELDVAGRDELGPD